MSAVEFARYAQNLLDPTLHDSTWLSQGHLHEMCDRLLTHTDPLKQQRWIGFIQAGLLLHGLVSTDALAEQSKKLFGNSPPPK